MDKALIIFMLGLLLCGASAHAGDESRVLLDADFNNLVPDQQIGSGGPELGEPVSIDADLSAIVRAAPRPTPSLELSHAAVGLARFARFEFLGSEQISHGDLNVRLIVQAAQLDYFSLLNVREATTNTQVFLSLSLNPQGNFTINDQAGFVGFFAGYSANVVFQLDVKFHMDTATYDIEVDSVPLVTGRSHSITGHGIGAVAVGTSNLTLPSSLFYVDRIRVVRGDGIFSHDFES